MTYYWSIEYTWDSSKSNHCGNETLGQGLKKKGKIYQDTVLTSYTWNILISSLQRQNLLSPSLLVRLITLTLNRLGSLDTMGTVERLKKRDKQVKDAAKSITSAFNCQVTITQQTEQEVKSYSNSQQLHNLSNGWTNGHFNHDLIFTFW